MDKPIKITSLTPEELALLLSRAIKTNISGQDVLEIAQIAGIVSSANTISLIEFAAYLAKEVSVGEG